MDVISKSQVRWVRALRDKKVREREGLFVACGSKCVGDLLSHFECRLLASTVETEREGALLCTRTQLHLMTGMETPQQLVAVFKKTKSDSSKLVDVVQKELCLCLDSVQDPGNLGTIIRLADWFGVRHIFLGEGCADAWGHKTVSATMGSLARVSLHEVKLLAELQALPQETPIYGTFLDGENIYTHTLSQRGVIIMGNEGRGISGAFRPLINHSISIPSWPPHNETAESLNVAMATAIVLSEFRRRTNGETSL